LASWLILTKSNTAIMVSATRPTKKPKAAPITESETVIPIDNPIAITNSHDRIIPNFSLVRVIPHLRTLVEL
jgi:hypothetical protein